MTACLLTAEKFDFFPPFPECKRDLFAEKLLSRNTFRGNGALFPLPLAGGDFLAGGRLGSGLFPLTATGKTLFDLDIARCFGGEGDWTDSLLACGRWGGGEANRFGVGFGMSY